MFRTLSAAIVALCLLAGAAFAAGFRVIDIPADAKRPAIHGAMWSPCAAATGTNCERRSKQIRRGSFRSAVAADDIGGCQRVGVQGEADIGAGGARAHVEFWHFQRVDGDLVVVGMRANRRAGATVE